VCGGIQGDDPVAADDVGDLLLALVDKSLLQPVGDGLRYRMLETIREYGVERLAERAELDDARLRHARYFAALTADLDPVLRTRDQLAALEVIRVEQDNILGALRYLGDCGDGIAAVDLCLSLTWYWSMIGADGESRIWLEFALSADGADRHPDRAYAEGARAISRIASGEMPGPGAGTKLATSCGTSLPGCPLRRHPGWPRWPCWRRCSATSVATTPWPSP